MRWYGDAFGIIDPSLELKIKSGYLGTKLHANTVSFKLSEDFSGDDVERFLKLGTYSQQINEVLCRTEPRVMNRYLRQYFVSTDGLFRITVDSNVSFKRIFQLCGSQTTNEMRDVLILEFKYDQESEERAHLITGHFPFRMTKSSKYVAGIQKTYPMFNNITDY